jgi:transcriptional regulator with XRE-family HTH domain
MPSNDLGAFLSARRAHVRPGDVGVVSSGTRRVPGLRREEVAMLAGMSVDYYTRLEQGRERHPSASVLDAVSRALNLDRDTREHLFRLADVAPPNIPAPSPTRVDPQLLSLLDAWPDTPAIVIDRRLTLLARNSLAEAFYADFATADNIVRMTFLEPAGRTFFTDWHRATQACVANLRLALGHAPADREAVALITELRAASPEFRRLWDRNDVRGKTHEAKTFRHSEVGELTLTYHAFDVRSAPGQQLIVYRAESCSPSAQALRLLGTLAATRRSLSTP